jgi:SAM-dependent methyltransferase
MNPKADNQPADAGSLGCDYWEGCYQRGDMRWDKGAPSPGLVDFLAAHPDLPRGTVCSPGCGTGHDVRAWAQAGFRVTGVDIAPSAVRLAAERTPVDLAGVDFVQRDFLRDTPEEPFDWMWEHTLFCANHPSLRDAYANAVPRWVKPGGQLLAVHYLIPDEDGPPFGTTREELLRRFSPRLELLDSWVPRSYPNRTGLELMLWWRVKG